jgi:hypothetical protein
MEASVVAVVMKDLDSVFCQVLLKGKLGGKCFVGLVDEVEVNKSKAAIVVKKDGGALIAFLGECAFQLCIKFHFCQRHLIHQDTLSRFGCNKDLVVGLGFLALPGKLSHCSKKAACTLRRQHLSKLLWNLAIESKLLEL